MQEYIPEELKERVFVLEVRSNPEKTSAEIKSRLESIGRQLAEDCKNGTLELWNHNLFKHNIEEIKRMGDTVRAILFSS